MIERCGYVVVILSVPRAQKCTMGGDTGAGDIVFLELSIVE